MIENMGSTQPDDFERNPASAETQLKHLLQTVEDLSIPNEKGVVTDDMKALIDRTQTKIDDLKKTMPEAKRLLN